MSAVRLSALERRNASTKEAEALAYWLGDDHRLGFCELHDGMGFHCRDSRGQRMDGFPDVLMLLPGLIVGIEIKIGDDALSPVQGIVLERLRRAGALALCVRYGRMRPGEVDQDTAAAMIIETVGRFAGEAMQEAHGTPLRRMCERREGSGT